MGNRASCAEASGGDFALPPLTAEPPPTPKQPREEDGSGAVSNPGDYEELGKGVKEQLLPQVFDGCKVVVQKGLSRHLQTSHTLTFGSSTQHSQWQFGGIYIGSKQVAENDYRPLLMGDISSSGNFAALFMHQLSSSLRTKVNLQTQKSKWVAWQGTMDYRGADFTAALTLANPDPISSSGVTVLQYLQAMSPRLCLGTELVYQCGSGMQAALLSLGGRYKAADWEASARAGLHAWQLTYQHKVKDVTLVAECDGNLMQGETVAAVGYKLDMGSLTVRGKVDSHATVATVIEKRLEPLPASLMLSAQLNHWTDDSKVGITVLIG